MELREGDAIKEVKLNNKGRQGAKEEFR